MTIVIPEIYHDSYWLHDASRRHPHAEGLLHLEAMLLPPVETRTAERDFGDRHPS
jgi:hypothetical protein